MKNSHQQSLNGKHDTAIRWGAAKRTISFMAILFAIGGCFLFSGCGHRPTMVQTDQAKFPLAIAVYQSGCITCHGDNLQGGIGPNLQHIGSTMSVSQMIHQISVGGDAMPAYALPEDAILTSKQIHAVAQWLATKK